MTKTITICDTCGKEEAKHISIKTGRRADAAGQMEDVTADIDLCHACTINWLKKAVLQDGSFNCNDCKGTGIKRFADAAGGREEKTCPSCRGSGRGNPGKILEAMKGANKP